MPAIGQSTFLCSLGRTGVALNHAFYTLTPQSFSLALQKNTVMCLGGGVLFF